MKTTKKLSIYFIALLAPTLCSASSVEWGYSGATGPEYWGDLSPAFIACKTGLEQSPIDLVDETQEDNALINLKSSFSSVPLTVVNNGHTIQVNTQNGNFTKTERGNQRLLQFHFHSPSENTHDGQSFPLEAHFVHIDDTGVLSVIGAFFELGNEHQALKKILNIAPDHKGEASADDKFINPNSVLGGRKTKEYFNFKGSLTTPPCTEGVNWYVSKRIQTLSSSQLEKFQHLFHGGNARPVQPLNTRQLLERDSD